MASRIGRHPALELRPARTPSFGRATAALAEQSTIGYHIAVASGADDVTKNGDDYHSQFSQPTMREPVGLVAPAQPEDLPFMHCLQLGMFWGDSGDIGGLDRVYTDLTRQLPVYGITVTGLVEGPPDVLARSGGTIHPFAEPGATRPRQFLSARRTLRHLLREQKIDLVACHFALYGALAFDHLRKIPMVMHFHGPWSGETASEGGGSVRVAAKRALEGLVYRRADRIIVLSEAFGDLIVREFGVREDRVRLVPGHVDVARFAISETRREARLKLGLPLDRPILVTVRRLTSRMGIDRLIAAMPAVVKAAPDVLLCVGGAGRLRAALEQQVAESGLQNHVRFLGFIPDGELPLVFRAADINVVPSLALEGFGLVAAEALAAGTPSLVTPVGGLPEVVAPLSPDLVFPSSDVDDMAGRLVAILRGHSVLPSEEVCRAYAAERFPLALAAARAATVYRELAA